MLCAEQKGICSGTQLGKQKSVIQLQNIAQKSRHNRIAKENINPNCLKILNSIYMDILCIKIKMASSQF